MKSAIEGDCEPVFWQEIQVGHIRKVDNRLRCTFGRRVGMNLERKPTQISLQFSRRLFGPN
jgi:hypothetical protein